MDAAETVKFKRDIFVQVVHQIQETFAQTEFLQTLSSH